MFCMLMRLCPSSPQPPSPTRFKGGQNIRSYYEIMSHCERNALQCDGAGTLVVSLAIDARRSVHWRRCPSFSADCRRVVPPKRRRPAYADPPTPYCFDARHRAQRLACAAPDSPSAQADLTPRTTCAARHARRLRRVRNAPLLTWARNSAPLARQILPPRRARRWAVIIDATAHAAHLRVLTAARR